MSRPADANERATAPPWAATGPQRGHVVLACGCRGTGRVHWHALWDEETGGALRVDDPGRVLHVHWICLCARCQQEHTRSGRPPEEFVTHDFVLDEEPTGLRTVVDATPDAPGGRDA